MRGVRADVAAFMIGVNRQIETHQLGECAVLAKAETVCVRRRPVETGWHRRMLAALERVVVDATRHRRQLGDQVQRVVERRDPVLVLVNAGAVCGGELAVRLQRQNADAKLCHRVHRLWQRIDQLDRISLPRKKDT